MKAVRGPTGYTGSVLSPRLSYPSQTPLPSALLLKYVYYPHKHHASPIHGSFPFTHHPSITRAVPMVYAQVRPQSTSRFWPGGLISLNGLPCEFCPCPGGEAEASNDPIPEPEPEPDPAPPRLKMFLMCEICSSTGADLSIATEEGRGPNDLRAMARAGTESGRAGERIGDAVSCRDGAKRIRMTPWCCKDRCNLRVNSQGWSSARRCSSMRRT
jgi:hypothetical protein